MSEKIFTLLCALFNMIVCFSLLKRENKRVLLRIDNIVVLCFFVIGGLVFPFDYFYSLVEKRDSKTLNIIRLFTTSEIILYYFCSLLFLVTFVLSYRFVFARRGQSKSAVFNGKAHSGRTFTIAVVMLLIGLVTDLLFIRSYGSYSNLLNYSNRIRAGVHDITNNMSFLDPFRKCITLSCFLFFSNFINKPRKSFVSFIFFAFSFVYSILIDYSNSGRLATILFLGFFPVFYLYSKFKPKYVNWIMIFGVLFIITIFPWLVVKIGLIFSRTTNTDTLYALAHESSFPFSNFKVVIQSIKFDDYRFFKDLYSYPIFLLPSSTWRTFFPTTASDVCTILTSGGVKGTQGIFGEMPCDVVTFGFLQFGFIGIIVVGLLFGSLIALLFSKLENLKTVDFKLPILIYLTIFLIVHSIFYCDSYLMVKKMMPALVLFFVTLLFRLVPDRSIVCFKNKKRYSGTEGN